MELFEALDHRPSYPRVPGLVPRQRPHGGALRPHAHHDLQHHHRRGRGRAPRHAAPQLRVAARGGGHVALQGERDVRGPVAAQRVRVRRGGHPAAAQPVTCGGRPRHGQQVPVRGAVWISTISRISTVLIWLNIAGARWTRPWCRAWTRCCTPRHIMEAEKEAINIYNHKISIIHCLHNSHISLFIP